MILFCQKCGSDDDRSPAADQFPAEIQQCVVPAGEYCGTARRTGREKRIRWEVVCMCGITALGMAVWYTMQDAGCWDYKNGLLPGMLWLVGMISVAYHCLTQEE